MKALLASALFSVALLGCTSASSIAGSRQSSSDLGSKVLTAIEAGEDLSRLGIFHPNYEHEAGRVALLKGCAPSLLSRSRSAELHVDWTCPDAERGAFTRIYLPDGQLSRLEFQPSLALMSPSDKALQADSLRSAKAINDHFMKAVEAGNDPTLDGLIPITSDQLNQLRSMKAWKVFRSQVDGDYGAEVLWLDRREKPREGADTTIHFNEAGMPVGLWIRTSPIRTTATTSRIR